MVDELQQAADDFRVERELYEAEELERWLAANHLTFADWELWLEEEVITRKLRDALTESRVEQSFAEKKYSFDAATISQIVVNDEEVAKELRVQIYEENADFHKLARAYSIDAATRPASGYLGVVKRKDLAVEVEAAVFNAKAGRVVGPIKTDQGWRLIRVHTLHPATLDEATREQIKIMLFEEWLSRQRSKAQINAPLLDEIEAAESRNDEKDAGC
jgi:parvulin-like peptidyl-prolyl isomerase